MSKSIFQKMNETGLNYALLQQGIELLQKHRKVTRRGRTFEVEPAIVVDEGRIALRVTYDAEKKVAKHLRRLARADLPLLEVPSDLWGDGFVPHEHQKDAVELATTAPVLVLTGGPGTGKTTIIKKILEMYRHNGLTVTLMAPTGKAATKLSEQTGAPAGTIHRTLRYQQDGSFMYDELDPIETAVLVVDEASMLDTRIAAAVLCAAKVGARVLLIGDIDQLPSIDAGRVLHDIIASGEVGVVRLTKIFRQAGPSCPRHGGQCPGPKTCNDFDPGSAIPHVAQSIRDGYADIRTLNNNGGDFRFFEQSDAEILLDWIVQYVTQVIPKEKGIPVEDIQVLAAQKHKGVGVELLNTTLQTHLNPTDDHEADVFIGSNYSARATDKVIQTKNNYTLGVMNGEQGRVAANNPRGLDMSEFPNARTSEEAESPAPSSSDDQDDAFSGVFDDLVKALEAMPKSKRKLSQKYVLIVEFNGGSRQVAYTKIEARELHLAYAITVHKSQGSQFPAVVMVVHQSHGFMLTRQLVYTAVTRAEKLCILLGEQQTLQRAARNLRGAERRTQLEQLIHAAFAEDVSTGSSLDSLKRGSDVTE